MAKPKAILDTSIVIDLVTNLPAARQWAVNFDLRTASVASVTIMEVLAGAQNKQELQKLGRYLAKFYELHLLKQDSVWAVRHFRQFWLSHQIGMSDCFIGAIAARTQLPLYTLNIKDFKPLPGVTAIKPY